MKSSLSFATGLLVLALNLQAQTTWYITPTGTGARNGTSWSNAFSGTSGANFVNIITGTMQPGDTLLIGGSEQPWVSRTAVTGTNTLFDLPPVSQTYTDVRFTLTGSASGTPTARKTIKGVDRGYGLPVFFGPQPTRSYTTISMTENCSYLTIEDLDIQRREIAIAATGTLQKTGLQIRGVKVNSISQSGFYFTYCTDLLVENCLATKYNRNAFRVHFASDKVTFRDCTTDCTMGENDPANPNDWINKSDSPIGFHFHEKGKTDPKNTNILLENCTTKNNFGLTGQGTYYQGDGFMVQGSNDGVTFRKCIADGATDSGYDLKGLNQTINDSAAVNCKKSGVKIWSGGTFNNFASVNNAALFRFVQSGTIPIVVNNSTLHSGTSTQIGIYVEKTGRASSFNNCLFTFAGAAGNYGLYASGATVPTFTPVGSGTAMGRFANTGTATNPPRYNDPIIPWDGTGTNYDNQTFGTTKGYNSTVVTAPPQPPIGRIISINMINSSTNALAPSEVAGFIPAPSWNNSAQPNEIMTALVDSGSAAVSGATASFYYTNYGYVNATVVHPSPMDDDSKMMRSNRANSNTPSTTSTLTGIPYAKYDVYVYWGGRSNGETIPATLKVELQLLASGIYTTVPNSARYITDANRAWDGTYNESTAETSANAVDGNEYVVFRNLTTPDFRILTTGSSRTGISGIQIVERP